MRECFTRLSETAVETPMVKAMYMKSANRGEGVPGNSTAPGRWVSSSQA